MEIERKYLISEIPFDLSEYKCRHIEQGYLCTEPVVRIRQDNDKYELTYKSKGLMIREEYNMPLTKEAYDHLKTKVDGRVISKNRYMIPLNHDLMIELDIFENIFQENSSKPLILAEVEFPDVDDANSFVPPAWFGEDVTYSNKYHNSNLSKI